MGLISSYSSPKQPSREFEEAIYLLFVKTSTLPVWLSKFRPEPEPTGTTIISLISTKIVEGEELYSAIAIYNKLTWSMGLRGTYGSITEAGYQQEVGRLFQMRQCHPQDCEFSEVSLQVDVYCSKEEGICLDEINYIKHMVGEAHKENPDLDGYRLFLFRFGEVQDRRNAYKMAPKGFERALVTCHLLMAKPIP